MKIIPKFLNSGKAPTRLQIEQNKKKLKFLNLNEVKVKIDGSWGPWQLRQYNKIKSKLTESKWDWFTRIMMGAAMAENPAVMTASGWQLNELGDYVLKRTKGSDRLADNLAAIGEGAITAPTLVGDVGALYNVVRHPILSAKTVYNMVSNIPRLFPKSVTVYKGGVKPFTRDYTFFTTDKEYAKLFGPVLKYKLKYKHPGYTKEPLIYKNMEWIHFNIDDNLSQLGKHYSDIIIGHDALTNEGLIPSKGTEYVVWNPKQIKATSKIKL